MVTSAQMIIYAVHQSILIISTKSYAYLVEKYA